MELVIVGLVTINVLIVWKRVGHPLFHKGY